MGMLLARHSNVVFPARLAANQSQENLASCPVGTPVRSDVGQMAMTDAGQALIRQNLVRQNLVRQNLVRQTRCRTDDPATGRTGAI